MNAGSEPKNAFNLKMLLVLSFGHLATDICQSALPAILPLLKAKLLLSYTTAGIILLASNIADQYGVPAAMKAIMVLPVIGVLVSCFISYPVKRRRAERPS
jgi:hypothetical protein